jgi:hypothetical protein
MYDLWEPDKHLGGFVYGNFWSIANISGLIFHIAYIFAPSTQEGWDVPGM